VGEDFVLSDFTIDRCIIELHRTNSDIAPRSGAPRQRRLAASNNNSAQ